MQLAQQSLHLSTVQLHARCVYCLPLLLHQGSPDGQETQYADSNVALQDTAPSLMQHKTRIELEEEEGVQEAQDQGQKNQEVHGFTG